MNKNVKIKRLKVAEENLNLKKFDAIPERPLRL